MDFPVFGFLFGWFAIGIGEMGNGKSSDSLSGLTA
jgi:hypothetical protein